MKKKILIVEDEKVLGEMYQDKFTKAGFETILIDTAEEGIRAASRERPDLILLDILLPRANGISFLEKIKKDKELASIPVVAFSNYDDPDTKTEAHKLGAEDYLIKTNYTPSEVIARVKQILNEE